MSTIKVTNIEHENTANGGIQLDNAGHVTVDGVQFPTAGALSNRNLIINGAMQVAQRGTSSTSQGYTTVDRIKTMTSDTNTRSQQSLASSDTPYSYGFRKFYRLANDTASSAGASTYREIDHRVESQDMAGSGWNYTSSTSYVTLSFWVRASVSQTYYVYLYSDDAAKARYIPITLTANTWTKIEEKIPGDSSLQFDNNNGNGLTVRFVVWYGSTYSGSNALADTWFTNTGDYVPTMTSTWATTTGATFDFTGLQLEVGEKATPFEHRSYGDELARCQRYYQRASASSGSAYARCIPLGHMATNNILRVVVPLHPPMRAQPSFGFSGTFATQPNVGTPGLSIETSNSAGGESVTLVDSSSISGTVGNCISIAASNDDDAYMEFSAEL